MRTNLIICGEAVETLGGFPDDAFDCCVFSPPYDDLRSYNGYSIDLHDLGVQLYRVLKPGGVVAMVIQDQCVGGVKSLTSFRTIVDWCDSVGFSLWECVVYHRHGKDGVWWRHRFRVDHEYVPLFVKGTKPKTFNKKALYIKSKYAGLVQGVASNRNADGTTEKFDGFVVNETKCIGTVWETKRDGSAIKIKRRHPAPYPDGLPGNVIKAFTCEGDIVLDPMVGSGSTTAAANLLNRRWVGIDISEEYCELARGRTANLFSC